MNKEYQLLIEPTFKSKFLFWVFNRSVKQRKSTTLSLDIKNTGSTVFEGGSIYNISLRKPNEIEPQCLDKGGPALSIPKIVHGV